MKPPAAVNADLIDRTISLWEARGRRDLSREDARRIIEDVTRFISILCEWASAETSPSESEPRAVMNARRGAAAPVLQTLIAAHPSSLPRVRVSSRQHGLKGPEPQ